jgi:hypothetical protein
LAQLSSWKAIMEKRYKSDTVALLMSVNGSRISIYVTNICNPSAIGRKRLVLYNRSAQLEFQGS